MGVCEIQKPIAKKYIFFVFGTLCKKLSLLKMRSKAVYIEKGFSRKKRILTDDIYQGKHDKNNFAPHKNSYTHLQSAPNRMRFFGLCACKCV